MTKSVIVTGLMLWALAAASAVAAQPGWVKETAAATGTSRINHATAVFKNKLWIMGGANSGNLFNDVWYSEDGDEWHQAPDAGWTGRVLPGVAVFKEKLWIMGGGTGNSTVANDVWHSEDGEVWPPAPNAGWNARSGHIALVFDGKLWIMGGRDENNTLLNDVWYSENGETWTPAPNAGWPPRSTYAAVVFGGKMWVLGGNIGPGTTRANDVWYSADGLAWTQAPDPPWEPRYLHAATVTDNRMWVVMGNTGPLISDNANDAWYTLDGLTWHEEPVPVHPDWHPRRSHRIEGFDGRLWVLAGAIGPSLTMDDVWSYSAGPEIVSEPVEVTQAGSPYSYPVQAVGLPTPVVSFEGDPGWLTFAGNTFFGTPTEGDIGTTVNLTILAINEHGQAEQPFSVTVEGVPPQFTSGPETQAFVGGAYSHLVTVTGIPAPDLTAVTLPGWLSFDPASGELSGIPGNEHLGGSHQVTIVASNGWSPDAELSFTINVKSTVSSGAGGGGCGASGRPGAWWALMALLGLAALGMRRRRATRA